MSTDTVDQLTHIIDEVKRLPLDWHTVGSLPNPVLDAMVRHLSNRQVDHSLETGSGKSTLILSHISRDHSCFSIDLGRSLSVVRESPLLNRETVTFIEGPSQKTLPAHQFTTKLQFALLDGPHAFPFPHLEYYFVYPHLEENALLVVDDIKVPTTYDLFEFLRADQMFELVEVMHNNTAFFRRTDAPTFDPVGEGWWLQRYNEPDGERSRAVAALLEPEPEVPTPVQPEPEVPTPVQPEPEVPAPVPAPKVPTPVSRLIHLLPRRVVDALKRIEAIKRLID